jgi:hypothetical protein
MEVCEVDSNVSRRFSTFRAGNGRTFTPFTTCIEENEILILRQVLAHTSGYREHEMRRQSPVLIGVSLSQQTVIS